MRTLLALALLLPATALADQTVVDGLGYTWDLDSDSYGGVLDGTANAFDSWPLLCVTPTSREISSSCLGAEIYRIPSGSPAETVDGNGQIVMLTELRGSTSLVTLQRKIYVSTTSGTGFARYQNLITNNNASAVTLRFRMGSIIGSSGFGANAQTTIVGSSEGGTTLAAGQQWFSVDDTNSGGGVPVVATVTGGDYAATNVRAIVQDIDGSGGAYLSDSIAWDYEVTIPAGATVNLLAFEAQRTSRTDANTIAASLAQPTSAMLFGMTQAEIDAVVNFDLSDTDNDGVTGSDGDCDDADATRYPGATEACDGIDQDCDGSIDEGALITFFRDVDADGFGVSTNTTTGCTAPSGYVANATDCNDASDSIHPGATEVCDLVDQDCDSVVDDGAQTTFYRDADSDAFGDSATTTLACTAPSGFVANLTDCDDDDDSVYPGATETCDGDDEDCDGTADENVGPTWYRDADTDGFGTPATTTVACTQPSGFVGNDDDCDDVRAAVNPSGTEACNGLDDDCDGTSDESGGPTLYRDADGDTYGDASLTTTACNAAGYVANDDDCNDAAAAVHPNAAETCNSIDDDCDGTADESGGTTKYLDDDGDTYGDPAVTTTACTASGYVANDDDCNDAAASIHPGAAEVCDTIDQDCDSIVDEGVTTTFFADADADGFGNAAVTTQACAVPSGYATNSTDCNDALAVVYPGATELCDGIDDDCDGSIDEGAVGNATWYDDDDSDGYGDPADSVQSCTAVAGHTLDGTDCDDTDATIHPSAAEVCDGVDQDCDLDIDEGVQTTFYGDADADGFGDAGTTTLACSTPSGFAATDDDCDDDDDTINPGATEVCDGVDQNCDTDIDEGVQTTFYADADADGHGDAADTVDACSAPTGYVAADDDCDDNDATAFPGADETCDLADDDCDGIVDDNPTDPLTTYADADSDGFGDAGTMSVSCDIPSGYVADSTDCDDDDASINPTGVEVCNLADDDCDGDIDEGASDALSFFADDDADGYGDATDATLACSAPIGTVSDSTDCDDADATAFPGAVEVCDGIDQDCDTVADNDAADAETFFADDDGDGAGNLGATTLACAVPSGYVATSDDCDDNDATAYPGADEICDGIDQDCDGVADNDAIDTSVFYADVDADGFGDAASPTSACTAPTGTVSDDTDCDDVAAGTYPGATETCDGVDQDCNGTIDDGASDLQDWYADADADGYGDATSFTTACTPPSGTVADDTDCDDTNPAVFPGTLETCDGIDEDCDGAIDEDAIDAISYFLDGDGDGFGDTSTAIYDCAALTGYVDIDGDCDDADVAINPDAVETCDSIDQDCDGAVDDNAIDGTAYYTDADADGYGDPATEVLACEQPVDGILDGTDCDDTDVTVNPGATEIENGLDDDCDGFDETYDADGDGLDVLAEAAAGTDPNDDDTDDDTLSDGEEVLVHGTDPLLADGDGDAVVDPDEIANGTDPNDADTDDDGLDDGAEIVSATDPLVGDTDGDGLSDGDEVNTHGTDPTLADTDGGGAGDGIEVLVDGTDPLDPSDDVVDTTDTDSDGLTDQTERLIGTDPNDADTDDDRLQDGDEITRGTNPLSTDSDLDDLDDGDEVDLGTDPTRSDTDRDGLNDGNEVNRGTDPMLPDTDGDGLDDGDEVSIWGTDPTLADTDGGGVDDATEIQHGTDPLDPEDDVIDTGDTDIEDTDIEDTDVVDTDDTDPVVDTDDTDVVEDTDDTSVPDTDDTDGTYKGGCKCGKGNSSWAGLGALLIGLGAAVRRRR